MSPVPITGQAAGAAAANWQSSVAHAQEKPGAWARFTGLFSRPKVSMAALINTQESFKQFFQGEVDQFAASFPDGARAAFKAHAMEVMGGIVRDCMDPAHDEAVQRGDGKLSGRTLNQAVKSANARADAALRQLQIAATRQRIADTPQGDIRPQVLKRPDGGFSVIRQAPGIENLVLRGGGAKGIGNPPALAEMERAGVLSGLNRVVGTSAGALTATLLASGMSAEGFQEFASSLDMGALKGKPEHYAEKYPNVHVSATGFHAGLALQTLDQTSASTVSRYLNGQWESPAFQQKLQQLSPDDRIRMEALRHQNFETDRTQQMVTFHDLHVLHGLDPARFKELTLTGWDATKKQEVYFSADTHPNMPIAVAGRISMSIPVFFASVKMDLDGAGQHKWTDGGVGSNMPSEVITGGREGAELEETRARTMLMTFDEKGRGYTILHGTEDQRTKRAGLKDRLFGGNPHITESQNADRQKVHDAGPNAFVVFHGSIGTLDLSAPRERVEEAQSISTLKTLESIEQRMNQAYAMEAASVDHAISMMSEREKQAIREGGAPDSATYAAGVDDPQYRIDLQVFSSV